MAVEDAVVAASGTAEVVTASAPDAGTTVWLVAAAIVDEQARTDVVVLAAERDGELDSLDANEEILGPPAEVSLLDRELIGIVERDRQA